MSETKVKIIPKAEVEKTPHPPEVLTITVEIPVATDKTSHAKVRRDMAFLKGMIEEYPGPTVRFMKDLGLM